SAACQASAHPVFDLQSALTHEMGHFIGFDHSPDPESTMYFKAPSCEIKKRDLTDDDVLGLCTVYPASMAHVACYRFPTTCKASGSCGCTSAPETDAPIGSFLLAALFISAVSLRARRS